MVKVLFVCLGNICRSPTAQGVFEDILAREQLGGAVGVDSAGTHAYHIGEPPDLRAQETARRRGIDLSVQRARRVQAEDFDEFDYVLAMDQENLVNLQDICPPEHEHKLGLLLEFAPHVGMREVPDPYYGGPGGFDRVLDLIEEASVGLLGELRRRHLG